MMPQEIVEKPVQVRREQEVGTIAVSAGGAASRNNLRNIRLIIGREFKNRITQRSFIIMSIILLVIVFLASFIPTVVQLVSAHSTAQTHLVVVNNAGMVAGLNETALLANINSELNGTNTGSNAPFAISSGSVAQLGNLQNQVKNGNLDILLVLNRAGNQNLRFSYNTGVSASDDSNQATIQGMAQLLTFLDTAHRLGLTPAQTQRLAAAPDFTAVHTQQSQDTQPTSEIAASYILAYFSAILIYMSVGLYAGVVAAGVAEEKSSRMMELLVNVATPFQLLVGKIVGIGAACLGQMVCVVVVGIVGILLQTPLQNALFAAHAGSFIQYLTGVSIPFYLLFLVYVLLAFFLYTTLFAGLSSMVRRQEEVQNMNVLPTLLMISGYLLFFFAVYTPDAPLTKVLSYIPFWTPWIMMARIARGTVAWWEIVATIAIMIVTILVSMRFAARLYRFGVLMYGQRPGLGRIVELALKQ